MKTGFRVFLAAFVTLGASWCGFVLAPVLQLGTEQQTAVLNSSDIYPNQRPGDATMGLQVYRAAGCAACHTTQIRQSGVTCEIALTSLGKNPPVEFKKFIASLLELPEFHSCSNSVTTQLQAWGGEMPDTVTNLNSDDANGLLEHISAAGCKAEVHVVATGPDIARGWGSRRSVAEDFLWDDPVQLGDLRAGPDLADVGDRYQFNWQLQHLYAPQSLVKDSAMPPFRFLFEVRKIGDTPSPDALQLPAAFAPPAGYEVVPTDDARNLAAYLMSLRADVPLHDAPFTPIISETNTP
ncbi:MAG TPA: cbb3-type cytochrome c oxidase subunit II [Verrucomicrobiae bacterium]|nr:cbb3-type cytochrome c oxidase subunit II [Verrucomicrobiae bacterium]